MTRGVHVTHSAAARRLSEETKPCENPGEKLIAKNKNQNTFAKRQREQEKKRKAEEKLARRARKNGTEGAPSSLPLGYTSQNGPFPERFSGIIGGRSLRHIFLPLTLIRSIHRSGSSPAGGSITNASPHSCSSLLAIPL